MPSSSDFNLHRLDKTKRKITRQIFIPISSTKLMELKQKLAEDDCFGQKGATVNRQRIFYLGRELKSGGRSLSNLGLGKYNINVLHLYIRPKKEGEDDDDNDHNYIEKISTTTTATTILSEASPRKRRKANTTTIEQNPSSNIQRDNIDINGYNNNSSNCIVSSSSRSSLSSTPYFNNTIELLDSSDDEVEVIDAI